jgi:hypothetical protein
MVHIASALLTSEVKIKFCRNDCGPAHCVRSSLLCSGHLVFLDEKILPHDGSMWQALLIQKHTILHEVNWCSESLYSVTVLDSTQYNEWSNAHWTGWSRSSHPMALVHFWKHFVSSMMKNSYLILENPLFLMLSLFGSMFVSNFQFNEDCKIKN